MKRILIAMLKPLSLVPAILMMCLIFSFSSQTGVQSSGLSQKVTYLLVNAADHVMDKGWSESQKEELTEHYEFYVRKAAHMTEYCILAMTVALPFAVYGAHGFVTLLLVGLICVAFAAGDEYHQSFVANRGPSIRDVCIDSCGALIGIVLTHILRWIALGGKSHL
ncbi:MAG: VanZ family protein [Lachnospiraceae bacterium]|nr:VanZ family protein [Lachnospiraceae bacterium]